MQEAFRAKYAGHICAVSHRWDSIDAPDSTGEQLRALRTHLQEHPQLELVWFDYSCLVQVKKPKKRTPAEQCLFGWQLGNVNILYVGCAVLLLIDMTYLSRFWTQFEGWLSMQVCRPGGLEPAGPKGRRWTMMCIYNAQAGYEDKKLFDMWRHKRPEEVREKLAQPDVAVTNASDKTIQLEKIAVLDRAVKAFFTLENAQALHKGGATGAELMADGFELAMLVDAEIVSIVDSAALLASIDPETDPEIEASMDEAVTSTQAEASTKGTVTPTQATPAEPRASADVARPKSAACAIL